MTILHLYYYCIVLVMYNRLYKGGSNLEGGTFIQLRNLINRRNVATDVSGRFNQAVDFFELVVRCHITAAAMHYFGMKNVSDVPTQNFPLMAISTKDKWYILKKTVVRIIDRYVIVDQMQQLQMVNETSNARNTYDANPHVARIQAEHCYAAPCHPHLFRIQAEHDYFRSASAPPPKKKSRKLPQWLDTNESQHSPSLSVRRTAPDGVLEYACAVLNDGLFLLEFRDAIHEGDGERIARCWKVMLLYFSYGNRSKYALEAVHLQAALNGCVSPCIREELLWCRVVNTHGGVGRNIPSDLFMEHLNRTLKDYLKGLGANISDNTILQTGKSLRGLMELITYFDTICDITPDSIHHTKHSPSKDEELIMKELTSESKVFDYIPGRHHRSFKDIKAHVSSSIDTFKLVTMIKRHQQAIADYMDLKEILKSECQRK